MISILRRPGKSIILLLLVLILGSIVSGALAVEGAIVNTDANLRRNMRPIITFELDREMFFEENDMMPSMPTLIPTEVIIEIGNLPYVSHFDYSYRTGVGSFELEDYWSQLFPVGENLNSDWITLNLIGSSNLELMDITEGTINLVDGRMFTSSEINDGAKVAVISREFAEINQLSVGSMFQVSNVIFNQPEGSFSTSEDDVFARIDYELEIIGLFDIVRRNLEDLSDHEVHQELNRIGIITHRIYVPNVIAREAQSFTSEQERLMIMENDLPEIWLSMETVDALFVLYDPLALDAFRAIAQPMLPDFWTMIDLTDTFGAISNSMATLQHVADWILWGAILATLMILSLLIMLFLRDRRHEIGIYLALGEKGVRIIAQVVLEIVVIALIGVMFAVFVGNLVSANMSLFMLRTELSHETNKVQSMATAVDPDALVFRWNGMAVEELSPEEMLAAFDVSLDLTTTLIFYSVGLFVVLLSTVLPVIYITKMNPKKVLM